MSNNGFGTAVLLTLVSDGVLRTVWMVGCLFSTIGFLLAGILFFMMYPTWFIVSLIAFWMAYKCIMSTSNYWWERWTGEYESDLDLSFLTPPYIQDNLMDMQQGVYQPRHAARVDVYGNPL
jgi:hypothetical protein